MLVTILVTIFKHMKIKIVIEASINQDVPSDLCDDLAVEEIVNDSVAYMCDQLNIGTLAETTVTVDYDEEA